MNENQRDALDEVSERIKSTCMRCPDKNNCRAKGSMEKIIECSIERGKTFDCAMAEMVKLGFSGRVTIEGGAEQISEMKKEFDRYLEVA